MQFICDYFVFYDNEWAKSFLHSILQATFKPIPYKYQSPLPESKSFSDYVMDADELGNEIVAGQSGPLRLGQRIGAGKEGIVYHIKDDNDSVVKIFKRDLRRAKEGKLRAMVKEENRPVDLTLEDDGVRSIIWPEEIVETHVNGAFLGFRMPKKNIDETQPAISYALAELRWEVSTQVERMRVARNFAAMVETIHKQGHAIGDFNDDNIFIDDGYITLIDCDAFHIYANGRTFGGDTWYPEHAPPEERPSDRKAAQKADLFSLGIYIFRFFLEGNHPFAATGPNAETGQLRDMILNNPFPYTDSNPGVQPHAQLQSKYEELPKEIRVAFENCFIAGKNNPEKRPDAEQWRATIEDSSALEIKYKSPQMNSIEPTIWEDWNCRESDRSTDNFRDDENPWDEWEV